MQGTTARGIHIACWTLRAENGAKSWVCVVFRFAELTAGIFLNKSIKVYLFSGYTPTPYVVSLKSTDTVHRVITHHLFV